MAKMKISGATLSHPMPPGACIASKSLMLISLGRMNPRKIVRDHVRRGPCYFTTGVLIDFGRVPSAFRLESGEVFLGQGFARDQTPERKRDASPSKIECR